MKVLTDSGLTTFWNKIKSYVSGNVYNPDNEDISSYTSSGSKILRLADRTYNASNFSGKGYKILRKNIQKVSVANTTITVTKAPTADGYIYIYINEIVTSISFSAKSDNTTAIVATKIKNALSASLDDYNINVSGSVIKLARKYGGEVSSTTFNAGGTGVTMSISDSSSQSTNNVAISSMFNNSDTIYEIRYDFDLNGQTIKIPSGSVLKFNGGKLVNGTLSGDIIEYGNGFTDCKIVDCNVNLNVSLYINENSKFNSNNLNRIFEVANNVNGICYFKDYRAIYITKDVYVCSNSEIDFNNTIIYNDLYAMIMNIGNAKETYKDENISLRNMYVHSGPEYAARGAVFNFRGIKGLRLENITYIDAINTYTESHWFAAWCFSISGIDIYMKNIFIDNYNGKLWYDGIHFEYAKNVVVDGFNISSGDDSIAIHPNNWVPPFSKDINVPNCAENIKVMNGYCKSNVASSIRIGYTIPVSNTSFYINDLYFENITQAPGVSSKVSETYRKTPDGKENLNNKISNVIFKNITANIQKESDAKSYWYYDDGLEFHNCILNFENGVFSIRSNNLVIDNCTIICHTADIYNSSDIKSEDFLLKNSNIDISSRCIINGNSSKGILKMVNNTILSNTLFFSTANELVFKGNTMKSISNGEILNLTDIDYLSIKENLFKIIGTVFCSISLNSESRGEKLSFVNNTLTKESGNSLSNLISVFTTKKYNYGQFLKNIIFVSNGTYSTTKFANTIDYDNSLPYNAPTDVNCSSAANGNIKVLSGIPYIYNAGWNAIQTVKSGTTANRPKDVVVGSLYFDTNIGKPIYYKGSGIWVDASGANM